MTPIFAFDVDGVICERGKNIEPEFQRWFINWMQGKNVTIVTGNTREKTIEKIGIEIVKHAELSFFCMGNSIWYKEEEVLINQFSLYEEELMFINNYINAIDFPDKNGNYMQMRKGTLNLSFTGQNSSEESRKKFIEYDNKTNERLNFIKKFTKLFPRFEAGIGGDVSVDIFLRSCGKEQILELLFAEQVNFFGDRVEEWGVDFLLYNMCQALPYTRHAITNSYHQLKEILLTL
jgi:phosphomannomutase